MTALAPATVPASVIDRTRFTIDGGQQLESRIAQICTNVRDHIVAAFPASKLKGLLLAGGYGRGEGGVLRSMQGELPYNDLDFYLFASGSRVLNQKKYGAVLHHIAEELSASAGIEIELKLDSLRHWRRMPVTMFSYDVSAAHKWITGDKSLLAGCDHHRYPQSIPISEASRLLLNRCSGLLFAAEQLLRPTFDSRNADFVARNVAKAQLAFGDAILVVFGLYHCSCLERAHRLSQLELREPWFPEVCCHHAAGVEWKLHPLLAEPDRGGLQKLHREVTGFAWRIWQWLERRRLAIPCDSPSQYSFSSPHKWPGTNPLRNLLVNAKFFGLSGLCDRRYGRERLFRALPVLLWDHDGLQDSAIVLQLRKWLKTNASSFPDLVNAYARIWRRFN